MHTSMSLRFPNERPETKPDELFPTAPLTVGTTASDQLIAALVKARPNANMSAPVGNGRRKYITSMMWCQSYLSERHQES